jgi:hypothetical protein
LAPLDSLFGGQSSFYSKAKWQRSFAWMPHRCIISGRIIWLKYGYLGTDTYIGPGKELVSEYNWHTVEEHLIWCLKNG